MRENDTPSISRRRRADAFEYALNATRAVALAIVQSKCFDATNSWQRMRTSNRRYSMFEDVKGIA